MTAQPHERADRTRDFIAACRARGMSATGIRRALGLTESEAAAWGIVELEPMFRERSTPPSFDEIATSAAEHSGAFLEEMYEPARSDYPTALARCVAMHAMRRHIPDADRLAIACYFTCERSLVDANQRRMKRALENPHSPEAILLGQIERELNLA